MPKRILVIDAHPDPDPARFVHALAAAYAEGAAAGGHAVERLDLAAREVPILRGRAEWESGQPAPGIREDQAAVARAEHLVLLFPLWLGGMPALLKAWLEQVMRPGFAVPAEGAGRRGLLAGRSARVVVTMGMPAFIFRLWFLSHGLRALERGVLGFTGIRPVRSSVIGGVETIGDAKRRAWLDAMRALGRAAR
jgi:putative NADPH-quinone reductase